MPFLPIVISAFTFKDGVGRFAPGVLHLSTPLSREPDDFFGLRTP